MPDKVTDESASAPSGVVREYDTAAAADGCQGALTDFEQKWRTALHGETPDLVPSKLPISVPPVRRVA